MVQGPCDILFVVPAFSDVHIPALGVSVLASQCQKAGFRTHVHYANLDLWEHFPEAYSLISGAPNELLLGEAAFAPFAFKGRKRAFKLALRAPLHRGVRPNQGRADFKAVASLRAGIDRHLDRTVKAILAKKPRLVGLTSSFQQNVASLAIARRLKALCPSTPIIIGGANAEGPMGRALLEIAPQIDFVFSGEADIALPEFMKKYFAGRYKGSQFLDCGPIANMARTSAPDYSDYFARIGQMPFSIRAKNRFPHYLPFESSRGCWWGQKHHCTFCGLNGQGMAYRTKTDEAVYQELVHLHARWNETNFSAADNIIKRPSQFDLLRRLSRSGLHLSLFFETKANLSTADLLALRDAGVGAIQPGIEALATPILNKIAKGLKAPHAIGLLRDAFALEIEVYWNLFSEIPDDCDEDFAGLAELLPKLTHLRPPVGIGPIRVDRFSPYFDNPDRYLIKKLRPFHSYEVIYPPEADLERLAYHFEYERAESAGRDQKNRTAFVRAAEAWRDSWRRRDRRPRLELIELGQSDLLVRDSRSPAATVNHVLARWEYELLRQFSRPQPDCRLAQPGVERLARLGLVVAVDRVLVSVVPVDPRKEAAQHERAEATLRVACG
ncbi:MAG TPA: RiPP maturation radical SAM C-methyltransferase [Allosphingosinicella sp.]|jgi:ribosomal peptide maturation radical SAM protein 1